MDDTSTISMYIVAVAQAAEIKAGGVGYLGAAR